MTAANPSRSDTGRSLSFGLQLGPQTINWDELRRWTLKAESLGFDSVWLADHFIRHFAHTPYPVVEMWSGMAALAACTTRIRIGSLVASVTHRNPGIAAISAATIDQISGGRFILGLGAGWSKEEHRAYGIPLPPPAVRLAMLTEAIQICRLLWTGDVVNFEGTHFQLHDAACEIKPVQQPMPILVGAMGEQLALRVVAEHADIWNMVGGDFDTVARKSALIDSFCEQCGRDPATLRRSIEVPIAVAVDEATARRRLHRVIEHRHYDPAHAAEHIIAGTPEQCIAKIARFQAMGISEFMLITLAPFDDEELDLFAERVLPAFARGMTGGGQIDG